MPRETLKHEEILSQDSRPPGPEHEAGSPDMKYRWQFVNILLPILSNYSQSNLLYN
jgi:hypothetical protein